MRFLLFVVLACAVASAQPAAEFQKELQAGIELVKAGKYEEARVRLQAARTIDRKAGEPHRQLAAVAQALKEWGDCVTSARDALAAEPAAKEVPEIRTLHEACRAAQGLPPYVGEDPLGEFAAITVTSNVNPATVKIRGQVFGGTPITPRPIAAGRLAIDVEKGGYQTAKLDIDALPGIVTDIRVELTPGEDPGTVAVARKTGTLVLTMRPAMLVVDGIATRLPEGNKLLLSAGVHVIEIREPDKDPWRRQIAITADQDLVITPDLVDAGPRQTRRKLGIGITGVAGGLLGLGVYAFYTSSGASNDAREILAAEITRPIGDTTPPIRTRADFEDARSKAKRWATISNLTYVAGLGALGAGLYLILTSREPAEEDLPGLVLAPIDGGAVIGKVGTW